MVRVDFNVPLDDARNVTSDARIRAALPTIRTILERGGRPVLMSHLGRPDGRVVESMRLRPVAKRLEELLGVPVRTADDCIGERAERSSRELPAGECLLLENLRFHAGETDGDAAFAAALARLGDCFVGDAFGAAHRDHASVAGVARLLPSAAGLLLAAEVAAFGRVLESPERPLLAVLGGAKVSDKLPVILNLIDKVDELVVGGAMAYTFLKQAGVAIGRSRCEEALLDEAARVRTLAREKGVALHLPVDHVCADRVAADATTSVCGPDVPEGLLALDIGPETARRYTAVIARARTIVWNGPMGVFEIEAFRRGTSTVAEAIADSAAFSVIGGGDSVAAAELLGIADDFDHVSTGGGASLELLEGRVLPGVAVLSTEP